MANAESSSRCASGASGALAAIAGRATMRTFRAFASPVPDNNKPNARVVAERGTFSVTSMCLGPVVVPLIPWSMPLSSSSTVVPLSARNHTDADVRTSRVSMSAEMRTRRPASVSAGMRAPRDPKPVATGTVDRSDSVAPALVMGEPSAVMA